ncbi:hypothetical protein QBC34DRAFT_216502 [Podospora aff. communis PSN243]|uniref:Uncharacterized protein n=1 Tax=Podospora aff. communis PSN243 TaxID=3040156 RepID=A0AAV9GZG1_9PEZI|nr:hypothetical protein QBC34DRAFT_216502 [Podospora aff. communis PSN243]
MRYRLLWAAAAAFSSTVEAKALKWGDDSPGWVPPRETEAPKQIGFIPAAPEPTDMPTPGFELMKRQSGGNNTCGYINGVFTSRSAIVCNPGWDCHPDQRLGVMGCCSKGNNCVAETLCWNSVQSRSYSGDDGGRIRWCSDSRAPYCALGRFTSGAYSSYEVLFCDANPSRTYSLSYFTPQAITTPPSSQTSSATSTSSDTSATPTASQTQTPAPSSSSAPAGAIAGGVVGGIAAIGLIALGIIFLWRRKSKTDDEPPPGSLIPGSSAYAAVSQYPPPQEPYDRTSMMKPPYRGSGSVSPYEPSVTSSALGSPPLGYLPQPYSNLPSPQATVTPYLRLAHHQPVQPYPQQYQPPPSQQVYQPQQSVSHELPVGRGDGELRELA